MTKRPRDVDAIVPALALLEKVPLTPQQILNSILEDHGMRKPSPIPVSVSHSASFAVHYGQLDELVRLPSLQPLIKDGDKFFDLLRMSVTEFLLLHAQLAPTIVLTRKKAQKPATSSANSHPVLSTAEQLLLWLFYTKGQDAAVMGLFFGALHRTTVIRVCNHVSQSIQIALGDVVRWPTPDERKLLRGWFSVCDKAIAVLDGTHCEIRKPTNDESDYHSSYKHKHTLNYLVCVSPFALVIYVSQAFKGRGNDRGAFNRTPLATSPADFVSEGEVILADGGFHGGPQLLCPVTVTEIAAVRSEDMQLGLAGFNDELTEARVLVEDVFSWLKARARILEGRFPQNKKRQRSVFVATCCVYNFIRMKRIAYAAELDKSGVRSMSIDDN